MAKDCDGSKTTVSVGSWHIWIVKFIFLYLTLQLLFQPSFCQGSGVQRLGQASWQWINHGLPYSRVSGPVTAQRIIHGDETPQWGSYHLYNSGLNGPRFEKVDNSFVKAAVDIPAGRLSVVDDVQGPQFEYAKLPTGNLFYHLTPNHYVHYENGNLIAKDIKKDDRSAAEKDNVTKMIDKNAERVRNFHQIGTTNHSNSERRFVGHNMERSSSRVQRPMPATSSEKVVIKRKHKRRIVKSRRRTTTTPTPGIVLTTTQSSTLTTQITEGDPAMKSTESLYSKVSAIRVVDGKLSEETITLPPTSNQISITIEELDFNTIPKKNNVSERNSRVIGVPEYSDKFNSNELISGLFHPISIEKDEDEIEESKTVIKSNVHNSTFITSTSTTTIPSHLGNSTTSALFEETNGGESIPEEALENNENPHKLVEGGDTVQLIEEYAKISNQLRTSMEALHSRNNVDNEEGNIVETANVPSNSSSDSKNFTTQKDTVVDILSGQYHEENPGQYHEVNPGQYNEVDPGKYIPGDEGHYNEELYQDSDPHFVELEKTDSNQHIYNVQSKVDNYIIGEYGKISIRDGGHPTVRGVRYTALSDANISFNHSIIYQTIEKHFSFN